MEGVGLGIRHTIEGASSCPQAESQCERGDLAPLPGSAHAIGGPRGSVTSSLLEVVLEQVKLSQCPKNTSHASHLLWPKPADPETVGFVLTCIHSISHVVFVTGT